jgi:hypothetical protein
MTISAKLEQLRIYGPRRAANDIAVRLIIMFIRSTLQGQYPRCVSAGSQKMARCAVVFRSRPLMFAEHEEGSATDGPVVSAIRL